MRSKLYKLLSFFGYEPVFSAETGFVLPENKILFRKALRKYILWMLFTAVSAGAIEFMSYIIAMFYFFYNGNYGWLGMYKHAVEISTGVFWAIMLLPVIAIISIHVYMYKRIKADDSRLGAMHCLLFLCISLLAVSPSLYFAVSFFFL